MNGKKKGLIGGLFLIAFISAGILRLHYTIEAVKLNKEISKLKSKNRALEKEISKEKIKLMSRLNLDDMRKRAEKELGMVPLDKINYVKIKKNVPKQN